MRWFFLVLLVLLLGDTLSLWFVAERVGLAETILLSAILVVVGTKLAFREGFRVLGALVDSLREGRAPDEGLLSVMLAFSGGLLVAWPGFGSGLFGLLLLFVPPFRRWVGRLISSLWNRGNTAEAAFHVAAIPPEPLDFAPSFSPREANNVVDTEGVEVQDMLLLPASTMESNPDLDREGTSAVSSASESPR